MTLYHATEAKRASSIMELGLLAGSYLSNLGPEETEADLVKFYTGVPEGWPPVPGVCAIFKVDVSNEEAERWVVEEYGPDQAMDFQCLKTIPPERLIRVV